jgi:hypothetical protein
MNEWELNVLSISAIVVGLWLLLVVFYVTYRDEIDKGKGSSKEDGGKRRARPPHNVEK